MSDPARPSVEYALAWPPEVFRLEAEALLGYRGPTWMSRAELLLTEAFTGEGPLEDLRAASWKSLPGLLRDPGNFDGDDSQRAVLRKLLAMAHVLPEKRPLAPYWTSRHAPAAAAPGLSGTDSPATLQKQWATLVTEYRENGYLDRAAPRGCVDSDSGPPPDEILNELTQNRIGTRGLWPLDSGSWPSDVFYSLIEVVHDLVARPRNRHWHDYGGCGWHFSSFAAEPGQALYRWRVNKLLTEHNTGLQLADEGEDLGRLIRVAADDRGRLVHQVLANASAPDAATIRHAVALFRRREADRPEKRSAVVALAGLLEQRRRLLKSELLTKDEAALFEIANNYDLRHRRADQRGDYDQTFLDWIFWWYLATLELLDRLVARQRDQGGAG